MWCDRNVSTPNVVVVWSAVGTCKPPPRDTIYPSKKSIPGDHPNWDAFPSSTTQFSPRLRSGGVRPPDWQPELGAPNLGGANWGATPRSQSGGDLGDIRAYCTQFSPRLRSGGPSPRLAASTGGSLIWGAQTGRLPPDPNLGEIWVRSAPS